MGEYTAEKVNQQFTLLDQYERRCIVYFLQETETDHVPINELVNHLKKQDTTPNERDELIISLRYTHLPKLNTIDTFDVDFRSEIVHYDGDKILKALLEPISETYSPSG